MATQKQIEIKALIDSIRTLQAEVWAEIDQTGVVSADVRTRLNALMITFVGDSNLKAIETAMKESA